MPINLKMNSEHKLFRTSVVLLNNTKSESAVFCVEQGKKTITQVVEDKRLDYGQKTK